jgi:hypothetical protein
VSAAPPSSHRADAVAPPRAHPLLVAGLAVFAVSWFVPVVRHQGALDLFGGLTRSLGATADVDGMPAGPDWLPGWSAFRFAWDLLVGEPTGDDAWKNLLCGATCLTNFVMLGAAMAVLVPHRALRPLGPLLLGCAAVDASWVWVGGGDVLDQLGAGYWLWLGSFVLAGVGLLLARRRG